MTEFKGTFIFTGTLNYTPALPGADVTAPALTAGPTNSGVSESAATISWTTDEISDTQVIYSLDHAYGLSSTLDATLVTSHVVSLTGLTAGSAYFYKVKSRDNSGNLLTSNEFTFTTSAASTCGPPTYPCGDTSTTNKVWQAWPVAAQTPNTTFADPVFGTTIVRAMTSVGACDKTTANASVIPDSTANNLWASDSSAYIARVISSGSSFYLLNDFNPTTMVSSPHPGTGGGACRKTTTSGWFELSGSGRFSSGSRTPMFSQTDPTKIYGLKSGSSLIPYVGTVTPTGVTFANFKATGTGSLADSDCFPDLYGGGTGDSSISSDDDRFYWIGNLTTDATKGQDHYTTAVVYIKSTNVCRRLNFTTGIISEGTTASGWTTGTIPSAFRTSAGHSGRMTQGGRWSSAAFQSCAAGCTGFVNGSSVYWDMEGTNLISNLGTGGHGTLGDHSALKTPVSSLVTMKVFNLNDSPPVADIRGTAKSTEHYVAWQNAEAGDTRPFLYVSFHINGNIDSTQTLENEVAMVDSTGAQRASRQVKVCTFDSTGGFTRTEPRAVISADGQFIMWADRGNACSQDIGRTELFIARAR